MIYLLLAYADEAVPGVLPASERQAGVDNNDALQGSTLRERGYLLVRGGLQSSSRTTVQVKDGELSLAGGPTCTAQEQLVEFFIITARDLNEAIRVAGQLPQARRGTVDVWPVAGFERPANFPDSLHAI